MAQVLDNDTITKNSSGDLNIQSGSVTTLDTNNAGSALQTGGTVAVGGTLALTANYLENAGSLTLQSQSKFNAAALQIAAGAVCKDFGTITANTTNNGTLLFNPGIVGTGSQGITGSFTQTSSGVVGADTGFQILINGAATLGGTFELSNQNGGIVAEQVMLWSSLIGGFSSIVFPSGTWSDVYYPSSLYVASNQNTGITGLSNQANAAGANVSFTLAANDSGGHALTYQLLSGLPLPNGVSFSGRTFSGTLAANDAATNGGVYYVSLSVTDQGTTYYQSFSWTVTGTTNHFLVSPITTSTTAGAVVIFTITALDANNYLVPNYTGTVHFTSIDGAAILPANSTLAAGVGTFDVTLDTAGAKTVSVNDTVSQGITGTSSLITVNPAAAIQFLIAAPSTVTAGNALVMTITAQDQFSNTVTGYAGTVHFTSSDGQAALPADATLTNGVGSFLPTLKTAGSQTLIVQDTADNSIIGLSGTIIVNPAAANHFSIASPGDTFTTCTTGTAFNVTVTALDPFGNIATGYTGIVHFTSSDAQATLPANSTLTSGQGTFSVTLKTAGSQTVTATDTVATNPTITGTTSAIWTLGLTVASFTPTPTGFTATFSKPFIPGDLTLWGTGTNTVKDVTLMGTVSGPMNGSLIIDPSFTSITFNATANTLLGFFGSAVLPDDTYTVTLVSGSGANGFLDSLGAHLDGLYNATATSYTTFFVTSYQASAAPVLGIPDFARGPDGSQMTISTAAWSNNTATITTTSAHTFRAGQSVLIANCSNAGYNGLFTIVSVTATTFTYAMTSSLTGGSGGTAYSAIIKVPNDSSHGIPITLYHASGLTDVTFTLSYNPTLLTVCSAGTGDSTGAGSSFTLVSAPTIIDSMHATANFHFHNNTSQSGTVVLGDVLAYVPNSASSNYRAKELLQLGSIVINSGAITGAVSANSIHVNAYFGDVSGNGVIDGLDVAIANNIAQGHDNGLAAFSLVDPVLIGDISIDYSIDAGDVSQLSAYVSHLQVLQIPPPRTDLTITITVWY